MKKKKFLIVFVLFFTILLGFGGTYQTVYADNSKEIYLGGFPAGFSVYSRGAEISGFSIVVTENGKQSPCKDSGLKIGDKILYINNTEINKVKDIEKALVDDTLKIITVERNGELLYFNITPAKELNGKYKLGLFIKEGINGIGTVTYIIGNKFAALGHSVVDEKGDTLNVIGGKIYKSYISDIIKSEKGKAGELKGSFIRDAEIGSVSKNLSSGVYGIINDNYDTSGLKSIETAEAETGSAKIYSTIFGSTPKEYDITIIKADNKFKETKNLVIKIIDKELLEKAGGIVQGMSGSPIVQNGKLVGAVTHVFLNDPTRGFGISIEQMLKNQ